MSPDVKRKHLCRASLAFKSSLARNSQKGTRQTSWEGTSPSALPFDVYSGNTARGGTGFAPKQLGASQQHGQAGLGTGGERRREESLGSCPAVPAVTPGILLLLASATRTGRSGTMPCPVPCRVPRQPS